jgi:hypothetical protein
MSSGVVEVQDQGSLWIRPLLPVLTVVFLVSGCLSDGGSSDAVRSARIGGANPGSGDLPADPVDNPPAASNAAPRIQGTPPRNVVAGQQYVFKPKASDSDGDQLTFAVHNLPAWANFDAKTGRLAGTPTAADVGSYKAIVVTVSDGEAQAKLPEFTVAVVQSGEASVTLSWVPPTENTDGTPLTNLKGYEIHYGNASGAYSTTIPIDNPGITRYVIDGLGAGTYFFAVTAQTMTGAESDFSAEVSTTI